MARRGNCNRSEVNIYDAELMFEKLVEQAINSDHIKKPISWALYHTWKWANVTEKEVEVNADGIKENN